LQLWEGSISQGEAMYLIKPTDRVARKKQNADQLLVSQGQIPEVSYGWSELHASIDGAVSVPHNREVSHNSIHFLLIATAPKKKKILSAFLSIKI